MSRSLASIVLRDEQDEPMGYAQYMSRSGWVWACSQCPVANRPGAGAVSPEKAVERLVDHIEAAHP